MGEIGNNGIFIHTKKTAKIKQMPK